MHTPEVLAQQLTSWRQSIGNRKRFLISGGTGYLVFVQKEDGNLELQASAGQQLTLERDAKTAIAEVLHNWGFRQRRLSANYQITFKSDPENIKKWSSIALDALTRLFDATETNTIARAEQHPEIDNSGLLVAMKHLAKKRDWKARTGVYMKLIESELVIPLDDSHDPEGPLESDGLLKVGSMGNMPVTAAFSTVEALDTFDPRGLDLKVISGLELFPVLSVGKFASIQINPRGDIRGELYANEIWTVTEGIKRLRGSH